MSQSRQTDTKNLLLEFLVHDTSKIMNVTRIFITSWVLVLVLTLGTNGIAIAASGVAHEINCADRHGVAHEETLQSPDHVASMAAEHDHESCMFHACPALFADAGNYQVEPHLLYTKLLFVDPPLRVIERVESLLRPPNT